MEVCPESLGTMSEYWYIERGLLILNNYFILENGNGIQVYQELVIFNNFVKFKGKSNF